MWTTSKVKTEYTVKKQEVTLFVKCLPRGLPHSLSLINHIHFTNAKLGHKLNCVNVCQINLLNRSKNTKILKKKHREKKHFDSIE